MTLTFSSNGWIPCSLTWCPRKSSSEMPKTHCQIDDHAVVAETLQYLSQMSLMLFQGSAGNEEVVNAEGEAA